MSKHVIKLFAVVTLVGASACELADGPAAVDTRPTTPHAHTTPPAPPTPTPAPPPRTPAPAPGMSVAVPRTLANGRPACGNVQGRGVARIDCEPRSAQPSGATQPQPPDTETDTDTETP